jgi:hypothetical protein
MHADERQFGPEGSGRWDFSGIHALFLNCTLKRSPELSHTEGLVRISREIMEKNGVSVEELRPVDYDIAPGVWPDMKEHEWEKDDWPDLWGIRPLPTSACTSALTIQTRSKTLSAGFATWPKVCSPMARST